MSVERRRPMCSVLLVVVCALLTAFVIVSARAKVETKALQVGSVRLSNPSFVSPTSDDAVPRRGPVQVVRFALYDAGILPGEARVASGRVVISITDFTGGSGGLVVQREVGREAVGQVRRDGARWRGRQELNLSPGTYHVYDASRRQNRATLIVEP